MMSTEQLPIEAAQQAPEVYNLLSQYRIAEPQNGEPHIDTVIDDQKYTTYALVRGTTTRSGEDNAAAYAANMSAETLKAYFANDYVNSSLQKTTNPKLIESFMKRGWQVNRDAMVAVDVDADFAIAKPVVLDDGPHWAVLTKGSVAAYVSSHESRPQRVTGDDGALQFSLHPMSAGAKLTFATAEVVTKSDGQPVSELGIARGMLPASTDKTIDTFLQLSDDQPGKSILVCERNDPKEHRPTAPPPRKSNGIDFSAVQAMTEPVVTPVLKSKTVETNRMTARRIKRWLGLVAAGAASKKPENSSPNFFKQKLDKLSNTVVGALHAERKPRKKRAAAAWAAVVGVAAVAIAAKTGLDLNPFDGPGNGGRNFNGALPSDDRTTLTPRQTPTGPSTPGTGQNSRGLANHAEPWGFDASEATPKQHIMLAAGDNPWSIAERVLGPNASITEIDSYKDRILELNNITEAESYHLDIGTKLKLPQKL